MIEDRFIIDFMCARVAHIREFTQGKRELFYGSALVQSATLRELHLLTDAAKRLSEPAKASMGEVMWREMIGFRNFLVHEYLGDMNLDIVWSAIENKLHGLEEALLRYKRTLP